MAKNNMYDWIGYCWNPLAGRCEHRCSYCSTNRLRSRFDVCKNKYEGKYRIIEREIKNLYDKHHDAQTVFVCSQNDLFEKSVPWFIIDRITDHCEKYSRNTYVFQSKNPLKMLYHHYPGGIYGTTIETNRVKYLKKYSASTTSTAYHQRIEGITNKRYLDYKTFVTIEPIMDFDIEILVKDLYFIRPDFINIGADSKKNNLPEPNKEKVVDLINRLKEFTEVRLKSNLKRIIGY